MSFHTSSSFLPRVASLTAALLVAGVAVTPAPVAASLPAWSGPSPIPGTAGQANPIAATAPNGGELVVWPVAGTTSPQNTVKAKLRQPGSDHWVRVPSPVVDKPYSGPSAIAATRGGDFWVTFIWEAASGFFEVYVARLDSATRHWTKPTRVFHDADYAHESPSTIAVSDAGEVFVTATAIPLIPATPPKYRAEVATMRPGSGWQTSFLSPANRFAFPMNLVANPAGQAAVSFIQGYNLSEKRVRAATRGASGAAQWKVADLSVAGDAQKAYTAIGPDGTAAVEWHAPSTGAATVRLATVRIGTAGSWSVTDAVTGGPGTNTSTFPVVGRDGSVTALWETFVNPNSLLYARQLSGGSWGTANPFSTSGQLALLHSAQMRPDGTVGVLYQQKSAGSANEGLRYQVIDGGAPAGAVVLTDAGDGSVNGAYLGVDVAYGNHVLYTRGDYPATDFVTMDESFGRPMAATSLHSGILATKAAVKGEMRVGKRVTCRDGYWVEATDVTYRWFRGRAAIRHATGHRYVLVAADRGHQVSCRAKAVSDFGRHVLSSDGRRVR